MHSKRIRTLSQRYDLGCGVVREWGNDDVSSIVYMIQYGDHNTNIDINYILLLLSELDEEDCMYTPSTFHMKEYYFLKSQIHDTDTPTYMEALSVENMEEYFKVMDREIQSLTRRDT